MVANAFGADPHSLGADEDEVVTREPPRPLTRELAPAEPFPIDAMTGVLGAAARAIHDKTQAPVAIGSQSVLAAAALAVQAHANVVLPTGQARPLSLYLITVALSGERKSSCDYDATLPIRRREKALREAYEVDQQSYLNDKLSWDKCREAAVKLGKGAKADRAAMKAALDKLGPPPEAPLVPILTCPEPTFEGLIKLFAIGHPSLGIFTAEGGQFIGGHGMADEAKLRTASGLSDAWDGEPIKRVRAGDGTLVLPGRRLSLHLLAQPGVSDVLFRDRQLADQGLLSRLLVTAPSTAMGTRLYRPPQPESAGALNRYGARLLEILETKINTINQPNEANPRELPLSPTATSKWINFADHVEGRLSPGGDLDQVSGLGNKLGEHASRIAGVLRLVDDLHASEIRAQDMEAGIVLAEHFAAEAKRVFGTARVRSELQLARQALDWLLSDWPEDHVSLIEIYQRGPAQIREKAKAAKVVGILQDHGWLEKVPQGAIVLGQRRRDAWLIVRPEL